MPAFRTLDDADLAGKRVLVRVDLNVPMEDGRVTDATRIERVVPTIREIAKRAARSSARPFRPAEGTRREDSACGRSCRAQRRARQQAGEFRRRLHRRRTPKAIAAAMNAGDILLLENTRFHKGEEKNDPRFVTGARRQWRHLRQRCLLGRPPRPCLDRRAWPSSCRPMPAAPCRPSWKPSQSAGLATRRPVMAIVGGAKVSTKIDLLEPRQKVDALAIGGGMANTFLAARGVNVGKSLCEHDLADTAREIDDPRPRRPAARSCCRSTALVAREFKANPENASSRSANVGPTR
jgi:phosphoglycerate kinase